MMTTYWKCNSEGCTDTVTYRFKGLCRSCTTYELGEPKTAVYRERVNADGSEYHKIEGMRVGQFVTRRQKMEMDKQYSKDRKMSTKVRKARQIMREEGIDMSKEELMQIGESVHVHDENCNHEEE